MSEPKGQGSDQTDFSYHHLPLSTSLFHSSSFTSLDIPEHIPFLHSFPWLGHISPAVESGGGSSVHS